LSFRLPQNELQEICTPRKVIGTWRGRVVSKAFVYKVKYEANLEFPKDLGFDPKKFFLGRGMNVSCPEQ